MSLDASLDGPVHVELFDLDVEDVSQARQPVYGLEDLEQLLLLFKADVQVGGHGVGELTYFIHLHGRDHGLIVEILRQLHVLLEERRDPLHELLQAGGADGAVGRSLHRDPKVTVVARHFQDFAALHPLDQHLDVAVEQLETLNDARNGPHRVNLVGLGFVHRSIVLGGEENLLVARQGLFQGADGALAPDHERRHHVGKNHHVPNGHHRERARFTFFMA